MEKIKHEHHIVICNILKNINVKILKEYSIYFGGGTAISLLNNEFRISSDIDFLISDNTQFTRLRNMVRENEISSLFLNDCYPIRDESRIDQYAIRNAFIFNNRVLKLEIVNESRFRFNEKCQFFMDIPTLATQDLIITKFLASFDRVCCRDNLSKDILDLCVMFRKSPHEFETITENVDIPWNFCLDACIKNIQLLYEKKYLKFIMKELKLDIPHIGCCVANFKQWVQYKLNHADTHCLRML